MNHRERTVIYGLLGVLLLINALLMLDRSGTAAHAAPLEPTVPERADDVLGPADGVELRAGGDGDSIILRNNAGRPAWGEDVHHRAHSVAFVHIARVLNQQLAADIYEEERSALLEEIQAQDAEYASQLNELNEQIQALDRDSPEAQALIQRGNALLQEYRRWQQQMAQRQDQLAATHLEQAYRELISAIKVVADRMDIDIVERFIPTDDAFNAQGTEQASMAIRLRQVLHYPTELDITLEVMEELALDFE